MNIVKEPRVSFIIPSYQSQATLPLCLRAITGQKTEIPFEVIVVDSSQNGLCQELGPVFPDVRWIQLAARVTPGAARNRGLAEATADVAAFVDADVVLESRWLERGMARWDKDLAGICSAVEPYPERNPWGFCLFLIQFSKFLPVGPARLLRLIPSYAFLVERAVAIGSGGFPEAFPVLEDFLFSHKLSLQIGHPFLFMPDLRSFHINKKEWGTVTSQLRSHGLWSARARRTSGLPGGFLMRHRWGIPLLVPYRLALIFTRLLRWNLLAFAKGLVLSPALVLGLATWARSFFRGAGSEEISVAAESQH